MIPKTINHGMIVRRGLSALTASLTLFILVTCGGGGGSSSNADPNDVTITGVVDDGAGNAPIANATCRFVDADGQTRDTARCDQNGIYRLSVPSGLEGYINCSPQEVPSLSLSTFASTVDAAQGGVIDGENVTPATTVAADIIQLEASADPETRKNELLAAIVSKTNPNLEIVVAMATRLYRAMLDRQVNAGFSSSRHGDGGGAGSEGGGVGGDAGDGADFSPLVGAQCSFVVGTDPFSAEPAYPSALADFLTDGELGRPDLAGLAEEVTDGLEYSAEEIQQAFSEVFPLGMGEAFVTTTDEFGHYFLPVPANVPGFVLCTPAGNERMGLATYVHSRSPGAVLDDQRVTPATTVFSYLITPQLQEGLATIKENFLTDITGLTVRLSGDHLPDGPLSRIDIGMDPQFTNPEVGLVTFTVTALYNIFYKNGLDVNFADVVAQLLAHQAVNSAFQSYLIDTLGLPTDQAALLAPAVSGAEMVLGTTLDEALSTARVNVTVMNADGLVPGADVAIEFNDVTENGSTGNSGDEDEGLFTFTLADVPQTASTAVVTVSGVPGYVEYSKHLEMVALATVDLDIVLPEDTPTLTVTITSPTTDPTYATSESSLSISGSVPDDVEVTQVTWSNDRGGSGTCEGTTNWSASGIALQTGSNFITVTAHDAAGNTATDTLTVTYTPADTTDPSITINAPTSDAAYTTSDGTLNIGGTASDNVGVTQVSWTSSSGDSGTCSGTTNWSASGIVLESGDNTIIVTARDAAGNLASDMLTVTYTPADNTNPTISITSPTSGLTYATESDSLDIGGTASDNQGVTRVTWSNNRGGSGTCTGRSSWSASGITLQSGSNTITVRARDAAGNTAADTLTVTYTPDNTDPAVQITSPTADETYATESGSLDIGGTASDNLGVTRVTWSSSTGDSGTCTGRSSWSASGITLQSGSNTITVRAHDAAGNTAADTLTVTYTPDTTDPAIEITSPTADETYATESGSLDIGGTASDNLGVTRVTWSSSSGDSGDCTGSDNWSANGITLQSGSNTITVTAHDAAGNTAADTLTVTYTPDTTDPAVEITSPTADETYATDTGSLDIGGTASDNVGVTRVTWSSSTGDSGDCDGTADWSTGAITLQDGINIITISAEDEAGNTATDILDVTFTMDTTNPTITITSPTGSNFISDTSPLPVLGTASDDVGVTEVIWHNGSANGTCQGTENWSCSVPLLSGENEFTVSAYDAAGNFATGTGWAEYTVP